MKNDAAQTVSNIMDAKALAGSGVAGGGFMVHFMDWGEVAGVVISALVGIATLIYVCQGIRLRYLEGKRLSIDLDKKASSDSRR